MTAGTGTAGTDGGGRGRPRRLEDGAEEDRTPNLGIANAALSQLSYRPARGTARRFPRETRWYGSLRGLSSDGRPRSAFKRLS